jgi:hypothetical protein
MNLTDDGSRTAPDDGQPKAAPDRFYYHIRIFQVIRRAHRLTTVQPKRANVNISMLRKR